nr:CHAT domain-containing protein [Deltaproteobacteria bacterium]
PRLSALRYQPSLPLEGILSKLDPGTALISFSLGAQESQAFLLQPGAPLKVFDLAIGEDGLRSQIDGLVATTLEPDSFRPRAKALYRLLLAPLESSLASAQRLLILPDGPLHRLPWSALIRIQGDEQEQFLVEWKPISTAISATLWAQLKERRSEKKGDLQLAAYGAPQPPPQSVQWTQEEPQEITSRSSLLRGLDLGPLPHSRQEVEGIASLYPGAQSYLGARASEETARRVSPKARTVHFAVHGILDSRFPLNSGLVLTVPESPESSGENGFLQAWEIFEDLRLKADLVVLSACDSGLGEDAGDEGLIGLTRAFQYAGARTVAASLWKVSDQATSKLMTRFHHHLRQGRPMDQALRSAQLELLRSAESAETLDTSLPFYWAAFQLYGDWK